MARHLGVSPAYVNLLENNQRSVSVQVMLRLFEAYGVDWRDIAEDEDTTLLADLRAIVQDPVFDGTRPDLAQLRAALVHCPELASAFLKLHRGYQSMTDQLMALAGATAAGQWRRVRRRRSTTSSAATATTSASWRRRLSGSGRARRRKPTTSIPS